MTHEQALARLGTITGRSPFPFATSWPIEQVSVVRPDGEPVTVLVKRFDGPVGKPAGLLDPMREATAYELLTEAGVPAPRCLASGDRWLMVEHAAGVPLWQSGDIDDWCRAAAWAARLHARFASSPPPSAHLLRHDRAYYEAIIRRAPCPPALARVAQRAIDRLLALPRTFIHGELYPSNVIVAGDGVVAVDWEMAALGPGVIDLSALVSGFDAARAAAIVAAYGGCRPRDLAAARLLLALQWFGWSPGWEPPVEHRRDWLAEAHASAAQLE